MIKFYQDAGFEFRWRLVDGNNKVIADSAEGYASKWNALRAWRNVLVEALRAEAETRVDDDLVVELLLLADRLEALRDVEPGAQS